MRDDHPGPQLTVIRGTNEQTRTVRTRPALAVLDRPSRQTHQQLALPLPAIRPATLVSISIDRVDPAGLETILRTYAPRLAIDIRLSPSFSTWGLTRRIFTSLLEDFGVGYRHWQELCNRFVGDFLDYRLTLDRYAQYLDELAELAELAELIVSSGPVLLLGRMPEHDMSERGVLVDALARIRQDFDLIIP
jgi:hypothetical protein